MKKRDKNENAILTKEQRDKAIEKIKEYMTEKLDIEISGMQAGFLVDFITDNISVYYHNRAVADSMKFMSNKIEDLYLLMKDEEE